MKLKKRYVIVRILTILVVIAGISLYFGRHSILGAFYYNKGNYRKAESYLLEAKAFIEKGLSNEHPLYAMSLNNLGLLYHDMGDYKKAESYYLEVKAIRENALGREHPDYATSLLNLGLLYHDISDYKKAESYYFEAKAIRENALGREHPDYATPLNNLGVLYKDMGDYAKAESYYLEAKAVFKKKLGKDHPNYATSLLNLGGLYYDMGNYDKAESFLIEAITIFEKVRGKEHPDYAKPLNNLGGLYHKMGDYDKAESYYLEAKAVWENALGREHPDYATSFNNLGVLYHDMGDYKKAESYYLEAKAVFEKRLGNEHPDYAMSLNNLGGLYKDMGDYKKAESYYLEAISIIEKSLGKENPDFIGSLNNISALYLTMKKYEQALALKKEADQINTNLINKAFAFLSGKERETYWNTHSYPFKISYSLSRFYDNPESHALSYGNALFSKGILLRTTNAIRDSIYSSSDQSLIKQYEDLIRLRRQIGALQQKGGVKEGYIIELEQQADALDKSLTQASAAYMTANKELKADLALGWEDVRDSLQTGEAAIEFVSFNLFDGEWTGKTVYAALVLRHGMETPAYVSLCEETDLAEFFKKLDRKDPWEQARILYEEDGLKLYALVWQPLEKILEGAKTVYYSPSGLLHKLSFNAIPIKGDLPLSSVYDLNLVSSTREIARRKGKTSDKPRSAALYGGLVYDIDADKMKLEAQPYNSQGAQISPVLPDGIKRGGSLPYLAGSSLECWLIQQRFKANKISADLYDGEKGNEESFKNMDRKKTSVIHLATHGFFWDDIEKNYEEMERLGGGKKALENPLMRSGLALAGAKNAWDNKPVEGVEDGILFADEIANINLVGTELVVLSACDTALGVVNNSEGVFGLQRAFKLAGAETIVMSLWKIDDNATSELMARFYGNWLSGGMGKQEAFKEAQRWLRSRKEYSSPYYWAAFVMMD